MTSDERFNNVLGNRRGSGPVSRSVERLGQQLGEAVERHIERCARLTPDHLAALHAAWEAQHGDFWGREPDAAVGPRRNRLGNGARA